MNRANCVTTHCTLEEYLDILDSTVIVSDVDLGSCHVRVVEFKDRTQKVLIEDNMSGEIVMMCRRVDLERGMVEELLRISPLGLLAKSA